MDNTSSLKHTKWALQFRHAGDHARAPGVEEIYDITGLTELYGPGTGLSCRAGSGIHCWADYYILEVLNPQTLEPAAPGEIGEMVFTTLCKEGAPLIRYRSRDLTRFLAEECPCGCLLPRHDRILGRSDDVVIFRGVNIYPGQIDEVLHRVPGIGRSSSTTVPTAAITCWCAWKGAAARSGRRKSW